MTASAAGQGQVDLNWTASTDNVGGQRLPGRALPGRGLHQLRPGGDADRDHYTDTGLAPSTTYRYRVRAVDASGNLGAYSIVAEATTPDAPSTPPGLVGAWAFNEGAGGTTADASGQRQPGNLDRRRHLDDAGPLRRRAELQRLDQPGPGRGLGVARPDHGDDAVGLDHADRQPERLANHHAAPDRLLLPQRQQQRRTAAPVGRRDLRHQHRIVSGPTANPVNAWTHVALTYDGATLRLFVNGTQVASRATTGTIEATDSPLWIGGNSPYGEYFTGLIDEVRVYNRALAQTEIQADMNTGIVPDRSRHDPAVGAHGLDRDRGGSRPDEPDLDRLDRQRRRQRLPGRALPGRGLHQLRPGGHAERRPRYNDTGLARLDRPTATRCGRSTPPATSAPTPRSPRRRRPPPVTRRRRRRPRALSATAISATQIDLGWTASTDNVGVTGYRVERCQGAGCTNFAQVGDADRDHASATPASRRSTTYRYRVRAVDAAGNLSAYSAIATATTPAAG